MKKIFLLAFGIIVFINLFSQTNIENYIEGRKLKNAKNIEDAIAGAAAYERYNGINNGAATTYDEVAVANETGRRIGFAKDILNRIESGEFGKY